MYVQPSCNEHRVMGAHGFEIISKRAIAPKVEPGVPLAGSITLAGCTGDDLAPYDIYENDEDGEGWFLVAFDAEVGMGAELVTRVFPHPDLSASLIRLGNDAYVKCKWFGSAYMLAGTDRAWGHIVDGQVTLLTAGEAVTLGLEKIKTDKVQLVITDEPAIAEYLVECGAADPGVRVVQEASVEDVRGINVAGDVSVWFAAYARSVTSVIMGDITRKHNRRTGKPKELTIKEVRKNAVGIRRYKVEGT